MLHGNAFDLEEPLVGIQTSPPGFGAHALHPLRPDVVGRQHEGHAFALVEFRTGKELAPDHRQVLGPGLHIAIKVLDVVDPHPLRRRRRDLHQTGGATATAGGGLQG
ncbi:hypothetical protein D3C86_983140 [compost metagenome]